VLGPASAHRSRYGGTVVIGVAAGDPLSLDPAFNLGSGIEVLPMLCEQLYAFDAKSRMYPQLASALPAISADKLTYTIPIRRGIQFNDGTPLNAEAVVASIEHILTVTGSAHAGDFGLVGAVTAAEPYTVVIRLTQRFTPLTAALATTDGCVMSPAQLTKLGANFGSSPVGVGPFMFDHRDVGTDVTLVKSPYYYDKLRVHLDKIVFVPSTDAAAAAAAMEAGDYQVLSGIDGTQLPALEHDPNVKLLHTLGFGYHAIRINFGNSTGVGNLPYRNVGTPLAQSAKLRQAFEEAIDRATLVKVVYGKTAVPDCQLLSPASLQYDRTITCTPYNPQDGKRLVAASGFQNPTVHLLVVTSTVGLRVAQFIQAEEAAIGINIVIDSGSSSAVNALELSGNFDTAIVSPAGTADTDRRFFPIFATQGSMNIGGYSNPELDQILANGRKATSTAALKTVYNTGQRIILRDRPIIILLHRIKHAAVCTCLSGVELLPDLTPRVQFAQYK
jgi:peptide/nickel transport system substrate-binding protein